MLEKWLRGKELTRLLKETQASIPALPSGCEGEHTTNCLEASGNLHTSSVRKRMHHTHTHLHAQVQTCK